MKFLFIIKKKINGNIVGFMSMRSNIEYSELLDKFDLDIYETLFDGINKIHTTKIFIKYIN